MSGEFEATWNHIADIWHAKRKAAMLVYETEEQRFIGVMRDQWLTREEIASVFRCNAGTKIAKYRRLLKTRARLPIMNKRGVPRKEYGLRGS